MQCEEKVRRPQSTYEAGRTVGGGPRSTERRLLNYPTNCTFTSTLAVPIEEIWNVKWNTDVGARCKLVC